jgi:hypothetical protein
VPCPIIPLKYSASPGHIGIGEQPCGLSRQSPPGARQPENIEVLETPHYATGPKEIANVDVVVSKYENGRILNGLAQRSVIQHRQTGTVAREQAYIHADDPGKQR